MIDSEPINFCIFSPYFTYLFIGHYNIEGLVASALCHPSRTHTRMAELARPMEGFGTLGALERRGGSQIAGPRDLTT